MKAPPRGRTATASAARLRTGIAQRRAERREAGWRRSDARWEEIVAGATRVFSRLGYAQTSLEDVAAEVGINRATLYYYVGAKAELLVSVLSRPVRQMTEDLRAIAALDLPPREKLERAITQHMAGLAGNYPQMFIFLAENLHLMAGTMEPATAAASQEYGEILTEIIRDGMRAGVFRDDVDPHVAMLGIVGMCNWSHRWFSTGGAYTLEEIGHQFVHLALDGLCATPPNRADRARVRSAARSSPHQPRSAARSAR